MLSFLKKIWSDDTTQNETNEPKDESLIEKLNKTHAIEKKKLESIIRNRNDRICRLEKEIAELIIENDILKNNSLIKEDPTDKSSKLAAEIFGG